MINQITVHATNFRSLIERSPTRQLPVTLQNFPRGACGDAALLLAEYLSERGYGPFRYVLGEREGRSHAWIEGHGLIIDITADQFEDFDQPVFVSDTSTWHQTFDGEDLHEADFRLYDSYTSSMMGAAYRTILETNGENDHRQGF